MGNVYEVALGRMVEQAQRQLDIAEASGTGEVSALSARCVALVDALVVVRSLDPSRAAESIISARVEV